ncbi:DUF397 domain-containing protein [Streptomyces gobiensis]|uniref:DUF397 domain-containing protein n=1 Tax=Streptomyces gobiensis TaxID=2875706 RepID=UPI001E59690C|nr:DUF397 domain-containing protein [Streptomyces gobiensis]UGY92256.1 DUF397 domain-containing protein [Streptomyces gobiensis]
MTAPIAWQKSSYSQEGGDCVELAAVGCAIALRESDEPTTVIAVSHSRAAALVSGIKAGGFDYVDLPERR